MGFFDSVFNDVLKPVVNYGADIGKQITGAYAGGIQNVTGGIGSVGQGLGAGFQGLGQGLGQIGKGLGDMITNPIFLIAVGGVVLLVVLKR